jgi:ribose 5-phosphate isomerase B
MKIALASDHGGYLLKNIIKDCVTASGHSVIDLGTDSTASFDLRFRGGCEHRC